MKALLFLGQLCVGILLMYLAAMNIRDDDMAWSVFNLVFGSLNLIFAVETLK